MDASPADYTCEVAIIGGGPVGVTLAHLVGRLGLDTIVFEREFDIHAAPRAVAVDDLGLRIWRQCGLPDDLWPDMTPLGPDGAGMVFSTSKDRLLAAWRPEGRTFRWPRGVTMVQPQVEARLRLGLSAYRTVRFLAGHEVASLVQSEHGCLIEGLKGGGAFRATSLFVVGCEGGRSVTRRAMGVSMPGREERTSWLIVDTQDVAAGRRSTRDVEVFGCARRAVVSVPRKGGHRRWEFQLAAKDPGNVPSTSQIQDVIEGHGGAPGAKICRALIYRFAARNAQRYAHGRLALAGDSAHVMPPYAAQGLACGLEDAADLHWRLWRIVRHGADSGRLLEDYSMERRAAVRRSLQLSRAMALMVVPGGPFVEIVRDGIIGAAMALPPARRLLTRGEMRVFTRYRKGTFLHGGPGGRILPHIQLTGGGAFEDRLGNGFTIVVNTHDQSFANQQYFAFWRGLGTLVLRVATDASQTGLMLAPHPAPWMNWLARGRALIIRPDRVVMAHGRVEDLPHLSHACARMLGVSYVPKVAK